MVNCVQGSENVPKAYKDVEADFSDNICKRKEGALIEDKHMQNFLHYVRDNYKQSTSCSVALKKEQGRSTYICIIHTKVEALI